MGCRATKASCTSCTGLPDLSACDAIRPFNDGDSTVPGQIALQRMPCAPTSAATALVRPMTAALVVPWTNRLGTPFTLGAADDILTMDPDFFCRMPGGNEIGRASFGKRVCQHV